MNVCKQISNLWRLALAICVSVCVFAFATPRAIAQCVPGWLPGEGIPGTNGTVDATIKWDPDGPGPLNEQLVIGGSFTLAGTVRTLNVAMYDLSTGLWSSPGGGVGTTSSDFSQVSSLAVLPTGELVVASSFLTAGGQNVNRIATWNGTTWSALGSGVNGYVAAVGVLGNGNLVVGGSFSIAGGQSASRIAEWDGETWAQLGGGIGGTGSLFVSSIHECSNGDVIIGGRFATAGTVNSRNIARWEGNNWVGLDSGLGSGLTSDEVRSLVQMPNGDLIAGGSFATAGQITVNNIARWNGSQWLSVGTGTSTPTAVVTDLTVLSSGELLAVGSFSTVNYANAQILARWNGANWIGYGVNNNSLVYSIQSVDEDGFIMGGRFVNTGPEWTNGLAKWNGTSWSRFGTGTNGAVSTPRQLLNGDYVVGGNFTVINGLPIQRIAIRRGAMWMPLGQGMSSDASFTFCPGLNGDVWVGGLFSSAGGVSATNIAKWNGSSWSPLGSGIPRVSGGGIVPILTMARMSNGDLVAAGYFNQAGGVFANNVALWNGSTWSALGSGTGNTTLALLAHSSGDLIAGGYFSTAGGSSALRVARWNGLSWLPLGAGLGLSGNGTEYVSGLYELANGDILATGFFSRSGSTITNYIARWNGTTWLPLGSGLSTSYTRSPVGGVQQLPNGDVLVSGEFNRAGGVSVSNVARWDGTSWSRFETPLLSITPNVNAGPGGIVLMPDGDLVFTGTFDLIDGKVSKNMARYTFSGIPTITEHPQHQAVPVGSTLTVTSFPTYGYENVSVQWQRNGVNISDGPGGASSGGGVVNGATAALPSPVRGTPATLYISNFQPYDAGSYTAIFSNSCGSITSNPATITIAANSVADFNADTVLDFFDYLDFVAAFAANAPESDFNGDTVIDFFDYLDFVAAFANGC